MEKVEVQAQARCRSLRDWRISLGLGQGDVATWIGMSPSWVSVTERKPLARSKQAARLRAALLAIARARLEGARLVRHRDVVTKQARRIWSQIQEPDRGRLTAAMCDLVWDYLDSGEAEEADVIGFLMPGNTYRDLLDEFFDTNVEREEAARLSDAGGRPDCGAP